MSATHTERTERTEPAEPAAAPLHARSFKLRFSTQCELGRSRVSAVKPLALPATVTDKFHRREAATAAEEPLRRVRDMFCRGPREKYCAPLTSSHEYGWWAARAGGGRAGALARLDYRVRDSAWLRERVRALAADASYRR